MFDVLLSHENIVRLLAVTVVFTAMALWEFAAPRRRQEIPRLLRWSSNLTLAFVDTLIVRLIFPVLAVGFALTAQHYGWGLLNIFGIPHGLGFVFALLILDLAIYCQHVVFHAVPMLWRLHCVHHADLELDVSTGLRFHPIEILLSMAIKLVVVAIVGAPAAAVLVFEILLNASSLFNHSNVRMPSTLEKALRHFFVTPDMHRIHHSIYPSEANTNFGFNLSCWDRLFGTYLAEPCDGQVHMQLGVNQFRTKRDLWLDRMLMQPFKSRAAIKNNRSKPNEENDGLHQNSDND